MLLQNYSKKPLFQFLDTPPSPSGPSPPPPPSPLLLNKLQCRITRRDITISTNSALLLLLASQQHAIAETSTTCIITRERIVTNKVFLDISIDGEPAGRITIGLFGNDVPIGASRFGSLVNGSAGVSYRRKEFVKIMPNYIQHVGVRSYGVDAELANRAGNSFSARGNLIDEWERENAGCQGTKNVAWSVSLVVRDSTKPPPKMKLIAKNGKFQIDQEEIRADPNGTEFVISVRDSPELDPSNLVIGKVLQGMEVVDKIRQVKTVQENTSSPYFRAAKFIGDKRAVVAERGFNRPYSKVIVTNCGSME